MRFQQLQLLAYGKFTERTLVFPSAARDFHLIVGPNEAGKSTTRGAILDLLFGIETRSSLDFLHAKSELRLGATLQHLGAELAFVRTKARLKTLFDAAGAALPESALTPFLAGTDRAFFDQMFGLDHARLEAGGKTILAASNDVGQVLFQSAVGIGSLGAVRAQLDAEAEQLWAPRKSGGRVYYQAADELATADAALKASTVRTKDWVEAAARVQALEDQRELSRGLNRSLEADRLRLERVRRVAPALRQWREQQGARQQLGAVLLLPAKAAQQLADTDIELALAAHDLALHAGQASLASDQRQLVQPDERLLQHEADVLALAERRQQVRHHARDIDKRLLEVDLHWREVLALLRQLGWPARPEADLARGLPLLPARATVLGLGKRFEVLNQARLSAHAAAADKAADLASLDQQLQGLRLGSVSPALRAALNGARALGDTQASQARHEAALLKCERELALALLALQRGLPEPRQLPTPAQLRVLVLPTEAHIQQSLAALAEAQASHKALADRAQELHASGSALTLEITQYRNAHHPVSWHELAAARAERDATWQGIKAGEQGLSQAAPGFERHVGVADNLADRRHDQAAEVSQLQHKLDALERLKQQAADNQQRQAANAAERQALAADGLALSAGLGLAGLPLTDFEAWRLALGRALAAEDGLAEARRAVDHHSSATQAATAALSLALGDAGAGGDGMGLGQGRAPQRASLDALLLTAADAVDSANETRARHDELNKQREAATTALARLTDKASAAQAEFDAWQQAWQGATAAVGLPDTTAVPAAETALGVMALIDDKLGQMQTLRQQHIDTMQRDLSDFAADVASLAATLGPDLQLNNELTEFAGKVGTDAAVGPGEQGFAGPSGALSADAAVTLSTVLQARLAQAQDAQKEADRLHKALASHQAEVQRAHERLARAQATLLPLLRAAQVDEVDALRTLVDRSDQCRQLDAATHAALHAVNEGGDGLALDALEAEVGAIDAQQMPLLMADIAQQLELERQAQDRLTAELSVATTQLMRIQGQDDAARAEFARQDALAKMANAAERYVQVYTASRLLKWAVDRYRETRQGPMLQRAGELFAALTLGSFARLSVDPETDPPTLHGQRADGTRVPIAGLSDGTRDQLYLALRLAALELHLGQGHALPFVADDLFINYDEQRAHAGLEALAALSEKTQVIFLSHHDHLVPTVQAVFGAAVNVVHL